MTAKTESHKKSKKCETPSDLRKKGKILKESRDTLKGKNKKKASDIKKLRGNIDDVKESRDSWKTQYQQAIKKNKELMTDIKSQSNQLVDAEKIISKKDTQLLELQQMCDELKKRMK